MDQSAAVAPSSTHNHNVATTAAAVVNASSLETIRVMRRQEDSPAYRVVDYLSQIPSSAVLAVDIECRSAMMKWCYQVADACNYDRETVSIAMSCLDRFLCSCSDDEGRDHDNVLYNRNRFQLAAMAALYIAIKVHECRPMDARLMSSLSHYSHSPKDIEAMERVMLQAIGWRVNPPTAQSFVRNMVTLLPEYYYTMMDDAERETIVELTILQLDLFSTATTMTSSSSNNCHSCFYRAPASWLAFASLLNAIESVVVSSDQQTSVFGVKVGFANFEATMTNILRIDRDSLRQIRLALYEAIAIDGSSSCSTPTTITNTMDDDDDDDCDYIDNDEDEDVVMQMVVEDDDAATTPTAIMKHHVVYGTTQKEHHHHHHVHHSSPRFVRA
jgi:hypothetical protein